MGVLDGLKTSILGLRGTTPPLYEGERTLPLIPVEAGSAKPARYFPNTNPDVTPAIEMLTEAGEFLLTEDNLNITLE